VFISGMLRALGVQMVIAVLLIMKAQHDSSPNQPLSLFHRAPGIFISWFQCQPHRARSIPWPSAIWKVSILPKQVTLGILPQQVRGQRPAHPEGISASGSNTLLHDETYNLLWRSW